MAPTTRSTAARSTTAASTATEKKTPSKQGKSKAIGTVKKEPTKKIAKAAKKITPIQSPKYPQLPSVRSPSTATTTGQPRYQAPGAYTPTSNEHQPPATINKNGMSDVLQTDTFTPNVEKPLSSEKKSKRGYFPTRNEIEQFIGPDGKTLSDLHWKFKKPIRDHADAFWELCLNIADINTRMRPFHIFLRDEVEVTTSQEDAAVSTREGSQLGSSITESKVPVAGSSMPEKKSSFAKGKDKSKYYRWEPPLGVKFPNQTPKEQAALRVKKAFGSIPYWSPVPGANAPNGYAADVDTPRTPTTTPLIRPTLSHKGEEKATSPGLANPCKITIAAKSRRDACRIIKRQQLVQKGCAELKGLIQTLKERLIYFETLFERCAEGVDWETAELDVPEVQEKRLRFAE